MNLLEFYEDNKLLVAVFLLWVIPWKMVALWKSARNGDKWWFISLAFTNTFALLEALYIFYFSKRGKEEPSFETANDSRKREPKE